MYKPNVTECVPLNNGKETKAAPAAQLKMSVYLSDGSFATLKEIVKNKKLYAGKMISEEKNTTSTNNNYKIVVNGENVYVVGPKKNVHLNPKFGLGSMDLTKNPSALKKTLSKVSHPMKSKV